MMLFLAFLHYLLFLFSRLIYAQRCAIIVNDTRTKRGAKNEHRYL